jgi:hypothetical protein
MIGRVCNFLYHAWFAVLGYLLVLILLPFHFKPDE